MHCPVMIVVMIVVLAVSGLNPCIKDPCSCCKSGACEDPASHSYTCRGCIDGRTGTSCHEPCPETCSNCSQFYFDYETEKQCYKCKSGYYNGRQEDVPSYPLLQDCSLPCKVGCESCTSFNNCNLCKAGYSMDSTKECRKCANNCLQCASEKNCSQCADGYVPNGHHCQPCKPNCKQCKVTGECNDCFKEFYLSGPECMRCQSGCLSCRNENLCSECKRGYYFNNNNCFPCRDICISCDFKLYYMCNECAKGYYKSNNECYKCPRGCTSCQSDTNCQICDPYYKLLNGICYICPATCTECSSDDVCISCTEKYYNENGRCLQCPERCLICTNTQKCSSCMDNFYGTLCSNSCRENCKNSVCNIDTGICVTCSAGYFKDKDQNCKQCPDHCTVCSSNSSCLVCQAGFMGLKCEKTCLKCKPGTSCDKSSGYCQEECRGGFSGKVCDQLCEVKCSSCDRDNPSKCQACASNRYGAACMQDCPNTCLNNTCNDNEGICTYACNPGFWGPRCENDCASICSDNACFRNNGTCMQLCSIGSYGKGCQSTCNAGCVDKLCHDTTGECLSGCLQGFKGKFCEKELMFTRPSDAPVIAGITITILVIVAVIVVILLWIRYRKQRRRSNGDTLYAHETIVESGCSKKEWEEKQADNMRSAEEIPLISPDSLHNSEDTPVSLPRPPPPRPPPPRLQKEKGNSSTLVLEDSKQTLETEQPGQEVSVTEKPKQEALVAVQPKQESSATQQSKLEASVTQPEKVASVTQQPEKEASVTQQPKKEASVTQQPGKEVSVTQQLKQEVSMTKQPEKVASVAHKPVKEALVTQLPEDIVSMTKHPKKEVSMTKQTKEETFKLVTQRPMTEEQKQAVLSTLPTESEEPRTTENLNESYKHFMDTPEQCAGDKSFRDSAWNENETTETNKHTTVSNYTTTDQSGEQFRRSDISEEFRQLQDIRVEENATLNSVKDAPYSINARYISGNHEENKYIIALEPPINASDIDQYWKMILQEDCCRIVMLTNQTKDTTSSRDQYLLHNRDIKVDCWHKVNSKLSYVVRGLTLKSMKLTEEKEVYHLEYCKLPDDGIPQSLSDLRVLSDELDSFHAKGRISVHCRNDIGNTGIFIAFHILRNQANSEGHIDIYGCVKRLREQCPAMFKTEEQYRALYKALDKALTDHPTPTDEGSD